MHYLALFKCLNLKVTLASRDDCCHFLLLLFGPPTKAPVSHCFTRLMEFTKVSLLHLPLFPFDCNFHLISQSVGAVRELCAKLLQAFTALECVFAGCQAPVHQLRMAGYCIVGTLRNEAGVHGGFVTQSLQHSRLSRSSSGCFSTLLFLRSSASCSSATLVSLLASRWHCKVVCVCSDFFYFYFFRRFFSFFGVSHNT